jgi:GDP-4-dehydro-6-deoxy-D-mannose reductase
MKTYLITGFSGFVSYHFLQLLKTLKEPVKVIGVSKTRPSEEYFESDNLEIVHEEADLRSKKSILALLETYKPDYIVHLASYSSVGYSWQYPVESFTNNTNIFLNLIESIRELKQNPVILSIGSSEQYGNVLPDDVPLIENRLLKPISPYAVARVSQEMLSKIYADSYGLRIIMTRSFNHIGIKQKDNFVIPSFAKQMVKIKLGLQEPEIETGNLSIVRDFIDVRDVVKAYYMLLHRGKSGSVYNICSNKGTSLSDVLAIMKNYLNIDFEIKVNPALIRPNDNQVIIGSNHKIATALKWRPDFTITQSLKDIIDYWEDTVVSEMQFQYLLN